MKFNVLTLLDDILVENIYGYNTILNNSIVNSFVSLDKKKRNVEYPNLPGAFQSRCTVTQGNHDTRWTAEFFDDIGFTELEVINSTFSDVLYSTTVNLYVSELTAATVSEDESGRYICESSITGNYHTFILTNGEFKV